MFARLGEVKVKPGKATEFVQIFRDQMVPQAKAQAGFKGVTVLADEAADRLILISYWDSEAAAKAVEPSAGSIQTQIDKVAELMEQPPEVRLLNVAHQE